MISRRYQYINSFLILCILFNSFFLIMQVGDLFTYSKSEKKKKTSAIDIRMYNYIPKYVKNKIKSTQYIESMRQRHDVILY